MSSALDSGNETLFSDSSSCDLVSSPASGGRQDGADIMDGDLEPPEECVPIEVSDGINKLNVAPPKIQPYSGVLEKVRYFK